MNSSKFFIVFSTAIMYMLVLPILVVAANGTDPLSNALAPGVADTNQFEKASRMWLKSPGLLPNTPKQLKIHIESKPPLEGGKLVHLMITISNKTRCEIKAPDAYWAARVILDGKEFPYSRSFFAWNGPGVIIPEGCLVTGMSLSDWGVSPGPGRHKISVKIGEDVSNELDLVFPPKPPARSASDRVRLTPKLFLAGVCERRG